MEDLKELGTCTKTKSHYHHDILRSRIQSCSLWTTVADEWLAQMLVTPPLETSIASVWERDAVFLHHDTTSQAQPP